MTDAAKLTFSCHSEFFVIALDHNDLILLAGTFALTVLVRVAIFTDKN